MNKYIKFISPAVFLISLILIFSFRSLPSGKLWKEYNVIYVPVEADDSVVLQAIEGCGIENAVSLSQQFLPLALNENSIEISMLRLNYSSPDYAYTTRRNAFFFDKSQSYRLYYIPSEYKAKLNELIHTIEARGIPCGSDNTASYPWLLPIIVILLAGMLLIFVKHKLAFAAGSVIPLVFVYGNPFYPVAAATCLILLCLFFTANLWRRKDAVKLLLQKRLVPLMLLVSFVCAFAGSLSSGFLYLAAALGTASALYSINAAEEWWRNRKHFVPVYIRSARRVSIFAGKTFTVLTISTGALLFLFAVFFLTSLDSINARVSKLQLPSDSAFLSEELPQFEDYYRWNWNVKTYPYKSLNAADQDSDFVSFTDFIEDSESGIISQQQLQLKYDDSFRTEVWNNIDSLPFNSVEKVLKSEGEGFTAGYSALSSNHVSIFGIIMMFICLFILLFIYISIIIRKGINK